ncbi:MAG: ferritin-like domain-containing protein [Deltaproteobacteria bacterium]|nr:MAG: ferritin-like domain-containing protein [Deltaproteobacteria bacterium]
MKPQLETSTTPGANHTGLAVHPQQLQEMIEGTAEFPPTSSGGPAGIAELRVAYARAGEPHATMPTSSTVSAARLPLIDKLGARLQFERTGTRLYDALISKLDAYGSFEGGPSRQQLLEIREQELGHALLVQDLIKSLGGDPTVITPCASVQATASKGIGDVLLDPRTSFVECLETILVAELADQESWAALVRAAEALGESSLTQKITRAQQTEVEHLTKVRGWLEAADQARTKVARSTR